MVGNQNTAMADIVSQRTFAEDGLAGLELVWYPKGMRLVDSEQQVEKWVYAVVYPMLIPMTM